MFFILCSKSQKVLYTLAGFSQKEYKISFVGNQCEAPDKKSKTVMRSYTDVKCQVWSWESLF